MYETYRAELERLREGVVDVITEVRILVFRQWWAASLASRREESDQYVALFDRNAIAGARPRLIVPINPIEDLDWVVPGTRATAYGKLALGPAIAVALSEHVHFPIGPAREPTWRSPKLVGCPNRT